MKLVSIEHNRTREFIGQQNISVTMIDVLLSDH